MRTFYLFLALSILSLGSLAQSTKNIRINQVGFLPFAKKIAAVVDAPNANTFTIENENNEVVFNGTLLYTGEWSASGEKVRIADFSIVTLPGKYTLSVPDYGKSTTFIIADTAFSNINKDLIKTFYLQRASIEIKEEFAGKYKRPAAHMDTIMIIHPTAAGPHRKAGDTISSSKGWYDAGDYNKYIVNSGITTGTLLQAYEKYPTYYDTLTWNIPESNNSIPDILDEVKWNLDWMITMQDTADGGVYFKATEASFGSMVLPHLVNVKRYITAKSTSATLNFAAVMAMAARIYKPYYPSFADSCLNAAQEAWVWALANPNKQFYNPGEIITPVYYPAINTGGYGDNNFTDEKLWAASELLITTMDSTTYKPSINLNIATGSIPSWNNVSSLALYSLYNHKDSVGKAIDTLRVKNIIISSSSKMLQNQLNVHPYRTTVNDFPWGNTGHASNQAIMLLYAFNITKDVAYFNSAIATFDYILGRNATEYCFVSGYGIKSPQNLHHRPSAGDGIPGAIPGFLSGGPYNNAGNDCGSTYSTFPAKKYVDAVCSYSTNEIAINWQAPVTFVGNALVADYQVWLSNLPEKFIIPTSKNITISRLQDSTEFGIISNTPYKISTPSTWLELPEDTSITSQNFILKITERNNGDSIRNGIVYISNETQIIDSILISQNGKFLNFRIEAEDFITHNTVSTETTTDIGGGINVGWIDDNDTIFYKMDIPTTGTYQISYRVANMATSNAIAYLLYNDSIYSLIKPSITSGWQNWKDVKDTAYFTEGIYDISLIAPIGGYNLNYFDFTYISTDNIAPIHEYTEPVVNSAPILSNSVISCITLGKSKTIQINGLEDKLYKLYIYNTSGMLIDTKNLRKNNSTFDSKLPKGIYYLVLFNNTSVAKKQMIMIF